MKTLSTQKKHNTKKILVLSSIAVVIIGGSAYAYTHSQEQVKQKSQETAQKYGSDKVTPSTNTPSATYEDESSSAISSPKDDASMSGQPPLSQSSNTSMPATPIGTFVSNHNPNLDGSPRPNTMNSTCTTTPNTTCYIEFKNGSTVKQLAVQKTDQSGNTVWNWKLSDIGITEGSWTITAVATNGTFQARASDAIKLEVSL